MARKKKQLAEAPRFIPPNGVDLAKLRGVMLEDDKSAMAEFFRDAHDLASAALDEQGNTLLHWAASYRSARIAQHLLLCGADPSALNKDGWTPTKTARQSATDSALRKSDTKAADYLRIAVMLQGALDNWAQEEHHETAAGTPRATRAPQRTESPRVTRSARATPQTPRTSGAAAQRAKESPAAKPPDLGEKHRQRKATASQAWRSECDGNPQAASGRKRCGQPLAAAQRGKERAARATKEERDGDLMDDMERQLMLRKQLMAFARRNKAGNLRKCLKSAPVGSIGVTDRNGNMLLHVAAEHGALDVIKYLFEAGVELNLENARGWSPLTCAIYWEREFGSSGDVQQARRLKAGDGGAPIDQGPPSDV